MKEQWKLIGDGFTRYKISTMGRVKRRCYKTGKWKLTYICTRDNGYCIIDLKERFPNGSKIKKRRLIHRLVAVAFIPNPLGKPEVDHVNRIRSDNRLKNLKWSTRSENMLNTKRDGLYCDTYSWSTPNELAAV